VNGEGKFANAARRRSILSQREGVLEFKIEVEAKVEGRVVQGFAHDRFSKVLSSTTVSE